MVVTFGMRQYIFFWLGVYVEKLLIWIPYPTYVVYMYMYVLLCNITYMYMYLSDLTRIMFKIENVEVEENKGSAEVCLMLSSPTPIALNVDVTSIASGSATGEN